MQDSLLIALDGHRLGLIAIPHEISRVDNRVRVIFLPLHQALTVLHPTGLALQFPLMLLLNKILLRILLQPILEYLLAGFIASRGLIINRRFIFLPQDISKQLIDMLQRLLVQLDLVITEDRDRLT